MLDLEGLTLGAEERDILEHPLVGGVILFGRNVDNPAQIAELCREVRRAAGRHLLIAVDQEGGRVQRFREGFTRLPAMGSLLPVLGMAEAERFAHELGWLMAGEVTAVGCDFSFAPVLDLGAGVSAVIGDRAFAAEPADIVRLGGAFIAGMRDAGMAATGKHFPGHGSTALDSHIAIPVDERSRSEILDKDLAAFRPLFDGRLAAVMPAHVIYPEVDERPAGFSPVWLKDILRGQCGFDGVIFSDDLAMAGATVIGDFVARAKAALWAGCDMVLVCNDRAGAVQVLDGLGDYRDPVGAARLEHMRAERFPESLKSLRESARAQAARRVLAERFGLPS
ncbi:MAG: beta-N-acetylhexosaminidase [Gammaproteobacteria bacterium]|nr:beta-N-acetylhexosaminidase [Gammaproteobacteria bacterium]